MKWSVGSKVKLGVGITLVVLLINALLSYEATRRLISNDEWVRRTYKVIGELEVTLSTVKDAETGERGYIITGSEAYLEPYQAAISQIDQHILNLKQLMADNPERQADIPVLENMIRDRLTMLKKGIEFGRNGDAEGARRLIQSGVGKRIMDNLRRLINQMEDDENELLAQRAEDSRRSERNTILTFMLANIVACGVLLVTSTFTVRGIQARQRVEDELREAHLRAEAANNAKDEFLAMLSHELRTPLTSIFGWMDVLRRDDADEQTKKKALEVIDRNLRAQRQLIEDLLNISGIIAGKFRIQPEAVDPLQSVKKSIETARPAAEAKQIVVHLESDPGLPQISADPARLQQIVWNLLTNAIKFTPKGGTITVRVRRLQSELQIIVSDTGQGISPEFLPHVFKRFSQESASGTRVHGGLGLGLALVRHLVELHGGRVEAHSDGVGEGSTFTVAFPLSPVGDLARS